MAGLSSVAAVTCTAAFVFGLLLALLGSLKLKLAERLQMGEGRVGGLLAGLNLALIPMMLASGLLIDRLGVRLVLVVGALLAAVAVASLALRRTYAAALVCVLLLGAGAACLGSASVVLMPKAFEFGERELVASVSLGYVFVALGALMAPTLTDLLLRTLDFRKALGLLALVCLVPAVTAAFCPLGSNEPVEKGDLAEVFGNLRILIAGLAFLFYAPLEFAVSTWGTTYLTVDQGYRDGRAAWLMSFFWLAFLVGRVLTAVLFHYARLDPEWAPWLVFLMAVAAAAMMGNLAGSGKPRSAAWGLIGLGLALGPIFPTLVAVVLHAAPDNGRGSAYGAMFALGSLGSAALAPVLGLLARGKSVLRALRLLALVALLLIVTALALVVERGSAW